MRDPLASALAHLPVLTEGDGHLRTGLGEAGDRIAFSDDPICREAIAFTLRYASFVVTERRELPLIEGQRLVSEA